MSDKKPLYKQIMDKLKERIKSGDFEYDAPFVTEDRITKEYGVSRITAIRALEELEHDGLINRKRGSGSFVSKKCDEYSWQEQGRQCRSYDTQKKQRYISCGIGYAV